MSENDNEQDLSAWIMPIKLRIRHFDDFVEEEEKRAIDETCIKYRDPDKFSECMAQRQKKIGTVYKAFEYKTLYMTSQLEECLKTKADQICTQEALDTLDNFINQATNQLK